MGSNREGKQDPFFARYLEGQESLEPERSVKMVGPKQLAYKQGKGTPLETKKFPSDSDELDFYPHYRSKEDVPEKFAGGGGLMTLKFPSDSDEERWCAEYVEAADIPKGKKAKPKETKVHLKKAKGK